ncbi:hypothetical protein Tco_0276994 [Tanacetum coccineum]
MSSTEDEYIATFEAAMGAIWIHKFISGLIVIPSSDRPIDMYCDNIGAITIVDEPVVQWGSLEVIPSSKETKFKCLQLLESKIKKKEKPKTEKDQSTPHLPFVRDTS